MFITKSSALIATAFLLASVTEARFGNEASSEFQSVTACFLDACNALGDTTGACGDLGGRTSDSILAGAAPCAMQDLADDMIDFARQFDDSAAVIDAAQRYRALEKNTSPDFSASTDTIPAVDRLSLFCDRAPRNPELNGINQAQSPEAADGVFFDPDTKESVFAPAPGTSPFGGEETSAPVRAAATQNNESQDAVMPKVKKCRKGGKRVQYEMPAPEDNMM